MIRSGRQHGFTLIELLIVVAIIALLAAIAVPQYGRYQTRVKVSAGLYDITTLKTPFEAMVSQGQSIGSISDLGDFTSTTNCSSISASATASTGVGSIVCTLSSPPDSISGKTVTWSRSASGWACSTNTDSAYVPRGCTASGN